MTEAEPWRISLHGGHSGAFCEHAEGALGDLLEAAVVAGIHTFGVTEHAPRSQSRFLHSTEVEKGFDTARLADDFSSYARCVAELSESFADRLVVLRGFETEVVPQASYVAEMSELRERHGFEYMVGSVHYVDEIQIDGRQSNYLEAVELHGSFEAFAVRYYELVAEMVEALEPEVVGHLDLIRKNADPGAALDSERIRRAARATLEVIRDRRAILDLNTAGYRKGLGSPYPAPWLVRLAGEIGVPFCFGDDSHMPSEVGAGIDEARRYLLANGISSVTRLRRTADGLTQELVRLPS